MADTSYLGVPEGIPAVPPGASPQDLVDALRGLGQTAMKMPMVSSMVHGLMAPGQAYQSTTPTTTEDMIKPAQDVMSVAGVGAAPGIEKGAAGIFGGRLAKTADHTALANARLGESYMTPEANLNSTGWFRDPQSNKWKFEINDSQARFRTVEEANNRLKGWAKPSSGLTVGDVFHHPDLYAAYPWIESAPFSTFGESGNAMGSYTRSTQHFRIDPKLPPDTARNVMLHELQHGVQHEEGFQGGANPKQYKTYEDYVRVPGELEAHNVEARSLMSPQQRRANPPWYTIEPMLKALLDK